MFKSVGIAEEQLYGDVYASWLRDTMDPHNDDSKELFRRMVEAGFLDRQVVLRRRRLGTNVMASLSTALHRSPLTKLDLHGNCLRDAGCELVARLLPDLPSLTHLDLGACGLTGAGARSLGVAVAQHTRLAVLILASERGSGAGSDGDPFPNDLQAQSPGTVVLLHGCVRCRSLRQLDLSGNPLGSSDIRVTVATAASGDALAQTTADATSAPSRDDGADGATAALALPGAPADTASALLRTPTEVLCSLLTRATTSAAAPGGSGSGLLTSLRLRDVRLSAANAQLLIAALQSNSSLTALDLSENALPREVSDALGRVLIGRVGMHNSVALQSLCLSGNPAFASASADAAWPGDGAGKPGCSRRLYAALSSSTTASSAAAAGGGPSLLLAALASDRALHTLQLDRCGVDGAAVQDLCRSLTSNTQLRCLSLRSNAIDTDAAVELGRALCRHPALQRLYLSDNRIGDEGACALAAVLEGDRAAKNAEETAAAARSRRRTMSVTLPAATSAPAASANGSTLEVLDLRRAWLSDRGLVALGVALQGNATLRVLLLDGNHFTNACGESLAALLEKNHSVVECGLGATGISHPAVCRVERSTARNRTALDHAQSDMLEKELVRLHFTRFKLEEGRHELENLRERSAATKGTADNLELQFKQDQSDYAKRARELQEQLESYATQEQKYRDQTAQLEVDHKKNESLFAEDVAMAKERLDVEVAAREKVEEAYKAVEAELNEWKTNTAGRETAKRDRLAAIKQDMQNWAAQRKQYRADAEQLQEELKALEAKAGGSGGSGAAAAAAAPAAKKRKSKA